MNITLEQIKEMQQMGLIKSIVNVGIKPEQAFNIKKLVENGIFKSINQFVQKAVEKELDYVNSGTDEVKKCLG